MIWGALSVRPLAAVVVALDTHLWLFGILSLDTLAGPVTERTLLYGPILRTLPLVSMGITLVKRRVP